MNERRKKNDFHLNIGTSSILFIFVMLCLVSFAVLSLSSATSDYNLSSKILENSTAYYDACNEAEELLSATDTTLSDLYATGISRSGYYDQVGKKKSFDIPVTDLQTLEVEINILYPGEEDGAFYEITSWRLITTGTLEYDDSLPVYTE